MTAAQGEEIDAPETEAVLRWRFDVLARAGYDHESAMLIAHRVEVDLHEAADLLGRGCPPQTAREILL
jgi:hypothetical protein